MSQDGEGQGAPPTSAQASSIKDQLSGGMQGQAQGQGGSGPSQQPDVPAGRSGSGQLQTSETSAERTSRQEAAGRGTGGFGADGEAPRREVDIMPPRIEDVDRRAERKAERQVAICFFTTALASIAFVITYFVYGDTLGTVTLGGTSLTLSTPLQGLFLGIALMGMGVGPVLWAKKLMPDEEAVQEREEFGSTQEDRDAIAETFKRGTEDTGIQRRSLVRTSLLLGSSFVVIPLVLPLLSLGRFQFKEEVLRTTNWRAGSRMVRADGAPVAIEQVAFGGILTVFPEGHETPEDEADAATMLIRLRPGEDNPLPGREDWSVDGVVAYSKICTHAGCPVGLYEQQTHHLLCPCHQSTFLVTEHCKPIFGPAVRPLPQLRIAVDEEGFLVAQGDYPEPTGPSFWERA